MVMVLFLLLLQQGVFIISLMIKIQVLLFKIILLVILDLVLIWRWVLLQN
uniref:Uncharacterized protein n=1 Tax=Arundo donax TaxID=35708 RepID=A0A0A9C0H2_ARUDO